MLDRHKQQQIQQLNRKQMKDLFQGLEFREEKSGTTQQTLPYNPMDRLNARQRQFVEHWREIVDRSDKGLAQLFVQQAALALDYMDVEGVEAWLLTALEQFDQRGIGWAQQVLRSVDHFAAQWNERSSALSLHTISTLLRHMVLGLGGRELRLAAAEQSYTDTETIYLPGELRQCDSQEDNFRLYKALAVHHWAQTWYGSWRLEVIEKLLPLLEHKQALSYFAALERIRLDACIERDLPGVWRAMQSLQMSPEQSETVSLTEPWSSAAQQLKQTDASANDSLNWLRQWLQNSALNNIETPPANCYHGIFQPHRVYKILQARIARERKELEIILGKLQQQEQEQTSQHSESSKPDAQFQRSRKIEAFSVSQQTPQQGSALNVRLHLDQRPIALPSEMESLLGSMMQDFGAIPEEYFRPGGDKPYDAEHSGAGSEPGRAPQEYLTDNVLRYPEWDYQRQRFRPDYCMLREYDVEPGDEEFVAQTLAKYRGLLKSIRRSFEAIVSDNRLQRRQPDGDDIDLDALVAAQADARHGEELSDNVYTRLRNDERSIAVMFMVDMSGSTKGWVNEAEREALVLLCEALQTIGDQYAIYGFSGRTHRRVDLYRIKRFDEAYTQAVRERISGIEPRAYTRMGAPIRHLGGQLKNMPARSKLLITLSDGKPEDYGSYYGRYGIEDTRHALLELRRDGVHPFCITIDKEGSDYLPYMYGAANFACIDEVPKLPLKVADIYRKLTT